jgi:hypothetical protein
LQSILSNRHRRHRGIDSPILQARDQGRELERNEITPHLQGGAQRPGDLDVETLKLAIVVTEAERRALVLNPDAQRGVIGHGDRCSGREQKSHGRRKDPHPHHFQAGVSCHFR